MSFVGCRLPSVGFQRLGVYLSVSVICQVLTVDGPVLLLVIVDCWLLDVGCWLMALSLTSSIRCPSCQRYSWENDINEWGDIVLVLYLVKWVGIMRVWGYYCWNAGTVKGLHNKRPRVFFAVVFVGSFPLAWDLNCKELLHNKRRFNWVRAVVLSMDHIVQIWHGGLTWAPIYVPILCMQKGARPKVSLRWQDLRLNTCTQNG